MSFTPTFVAESVPVFCTRSHTFTVCPGVAGNGSYLLNVTVSAEAASADCSCTKSIIRTFHFISFPYKKNIVYFFVHIYHLSILFLI